MVLSWRRSCRTRYHYGRSGSFLLRTKLKLKCFIYNADFQFGDTIIRNLYILYHYGNQSEGGNYMQVLSVGSSRPQLRIAFHGPLYQVTDKEKAWAEFDTVQPQRILAFGDSSGEQSMDTSGVLDLFSVTSSPTGSVPSPTNTQSPSTTLVPFPFWAVFCTNNRAVAAAAAPEIPLEDGKIVTVTVCP